MIEMYFYPKKGRKSKNLCLRIRNNGAKLCEVGTGLFCKPDQWHPVMWCKTTGRLTPEDKQRNIKTNARLKDLTHLYENAWDKLGQLGQAYQTKADLKNYVNGTHQSQLNAKRRLLVTEAADLFWEHHKSTRRHNPSIKCHCNKLSQCLIELGFNENTTLEQIDKRTAFRLVEGLKDDRFKANYLNGGYKLSTRKVVVNVWFMIFDYFYSNISLLKYEPVLPQTNPFKGIKVVATTEEKEADSLLEVHFYNEQEIEQIENKPIKEPYLNYARNTLLLQLYTGMSRGDLPLFDPALHVNTDIKGRKWIDNKRCKNGNSFSVPVTEKVQGLLDYFSSNRRLGLMFENDVFIQYNHPSTYARDLTELSGKLALKVSQSHKARHTFAVQMLNIGYSMEAVSRMMGHKRVTTTETYYGFVTKDRVINERDEIEAKLAARKIQTKAS